MKLPRLTTNERIALSVLAIALLIFLSILLLRREDTKGDLLLPEPVATEADSPPLAVPVGADSLAKPAKATKQGSKKGAKKGSKGSSAAPPPPSPATLDHRVEPPADKQR